jgi:hypothetical protein
MMNKLVALGLASVLNEASNAAAAALQTRAEAYALWEESPTDLHKTYHNVLGARIQPYLETALTFAKQTGYGELSEQYMDGLITSDEFFVKLVECLSK